MIRHLLNKPIAKLKERSQDFRLLAGAIENLKPITKTSEFGDCLEINVCPEDVRRYIQKPLSVKIRQLNDKTWRIWLVKN